MRLRHLERRATAFAAVPPEVVWATFADVASWPRWSRVVASVEHAPERWEPGARVAFTLAMAGARVPFDVHVEQVQEPRLVRWSSVRWTVTGTRTHTFEPEGAGTRITDRKDFDHPFWPMAVAYPRAVIDRMSRTWVAELAAEAERRGALVR
jgi:hypothetical protein